MRKAFSFNLWRKIHQMPLWFIEAWQMKRLKDLLAYAEEEVGMYGALWQAAGIKVKDFRNLSDLAHFPLTSKKVFLSVPREACIGTIDSLFAILRSTSGTTGEPFSFISVNHPRMPRVDFSTNRFLYWLGLPWEEIFTKLRILSIFGRQGEAIRRGSRMQLPMQELLTEPEKALKQIHDFRPMVISTFPSVLIELARLIQKYPNFKIPELKYTVSTGENLRPAQRSFIESELGCEVYDRYGTEETWAMAQECRYHDGLHPFSESFVMEIVDSQGKRVACGKRGRIVATDLYNYAMPFIRYETGDEGSWISEPCQCGIPGPRLKVLGRESDFIRLDSGYLHHSDVDEIMKDLGGAVLQYQVVKEREECVTLRLIPGTDLSDALVNAITEKLRRLAGGDSKIKVEFTATIARASGGKSQVIVDASQKREYQASDKEA